MTSRFSQHCVLTLPMDGVVEALKAAGFSPTLWPWDPEGSRRLLAEVAPEVEAIVTIGAIGLSDEFLDSAPKLGVISTYGAGYELYDPQKLKARGIRLINGGGANAEDVADLGMGLLLAVQRRIVEMDQRMRQGEWPQMSGMCRRLRGRRMGVIGLGSIGTAMARRAEAFGMEIAWWGPRPKPVGWCYIPDPKALAAWADVLLVACRPTPENEGLVDRAMLDALGREGVLINLARGSVIDEPAVIAALKDGRIGGAGLDVFASEPPDPAWRDTPNTVLHPHRGGATVEALDECRAVLVENLLRYFSGEPLLTPVN
jgi:lactate dehydrogenase-like 2-hydroxyacid dehydrogenase